MTRMKFASLATTRACSDASQVGGSTGELADSSTPSWSDTMAAKKKGGRKKAAKKGGRKKTARRKATKKKATRKRR
jgi:hypothetical protein